MNVAEVGFEVGAVLAGRYAVRACTLEGPAYIDYRVHDQEVEVELSLWVMDPVLFVGEEHRGAFEQAAREMRGVLHPNLRRLFDVGRLGEGENLYLTSQLGNPDRVAIRMGSGRTAPEPDILRYADAVAEALEAVHAAGQVHGRLVPSDLVEVAGVIKVSGAGLYGRLDPDLAAERWGDACRYVAPEVLETGAADPRSDVYSMAAILCELASGVSTADLADATEQLAAEHLSLADLFAHALSRAPERRPGRPAELVELMRQLFVDERVATVRRPVLIEPDPRGTLTMPVLRLNEPDGAGPPSMAHEESEGETVEEASPLFLHRKTVREPFFDPDQLTLPDQPAPLGFPPPPVPAAPVKGARKTLRGLVGPLNLRRHSTEQEANATPIGAAIDRSGPRSESQPLPPPPLPSSPWPPDPPARALPLYPPPRAADTQELRSARRRRVLVFTGVSAACLLAAVALAFAPWGVSKDRLERQKGEGARVAAGQTGRPEPPASGQPPPPASGQAPPPASAPSGSPPPSPARTEPCPDGMALVADVLLDGARAPFCIDRYESPGVGRLPQLGASLEEAAAACRTRGARLCRPVEWEDACRGKDRQSFPYGSTYVDGKCNTRGREVAAAGSFPECSSAAGSFDMSGNAAEWDADGGVRGASVTDGTRGRCSEARQSGRPRIRPRDRADLGFRCCADLLAKVTPSR